MPTVDLDELKWWLKPMWCGRCVIYGLYNDWPSYSYWMVLHEDCW